MISCMDIQRAISRLLKKQCFSVVAREAAEGGNLPCCTVDVFPLKATRTGCNIEEDSFDAEILYYSEIETQERLAEAAEKLKNLILQTPLEVDDRIIQTYEVEISKTDNVLSIRSSYTFEQFIDTLDAAELMEELEFDVI